MPIISFTRKQFHKMIDTIPDDIIDEVFFEFTKLLAIQIFKSIKLGCYDQTDNPDYMDNIDDKSAPKKNDNLIHLPKTKK